MRKELIEQEEPSYIDFNVASVSSNINSFGLRGYILIARSGDAYEAAASDYHKRKKGETVRIPKDMHGRLVWAAQYFEIPRELPRAPEPVIREVFDVQEGVAPGQPTGRDIM